MNSDVPRILNAIEQGDAQASSRLLLLVYAELRRLAGRKMAQEAARQTLQPTALVHEAYLRLVGAGRNGEWDNRGHFFAAAAEADNETLLALHEALTKLAAEDPETARLVELRYFAGLTTEQAAQALEIWPPHCRGLNAVVQGGRG